MKVHPSPPRVQLNTVLLLLRSFGARPLSSSVIDRPEPSAVRPTQPVARHLLPWRLCGEQRRPQLSGFTGPQLSVDEIAQLIQPCESLDDRVFGLRIEVDLELPNGPCVLLAKIAMPHELSPTLCIRVGNQTLLVFSKHPDDRCGRQFQPHGVSGFGDLGVGEWGQRGDCGHVAAEEISQRPLYLS
jgi:hypothetical protein